MHQHIETSQSAASQSDIQQSEVQQSEAPESETQKQISPKTHIYLVSNDEESEEFPCLREAAKMSTLLKDVLDDDPSSVVQRVDIPNVNKKTMPYVIQYMEHHWNNPVQPIEKPLKHHVTELVSDWDKKFLMTDLIKGGNEMEHDMLVETTMAANFFGIKDLLDLTCAAMASMIRGKSPEEIRNLLRIANDLSPEEEQRIREENQWVDE